METTVATLLLVTAAVVFAVIVVDYAVNIVEQTLNTQDIPQLDRIKNLENNLLNGTDNMLNNSGLYNGTQSTPTPPP